MPLALALVAATTATAACFWSYPRDLALVETNTRYWRADLVLAPGETLELRGRFPYARQMSIAVHRRADNMMVAAVRDEDIMPDAGATNPYRIGARRNADNRRFTLAFTTRTGGANVVPDSIPLRLLYRIYLPDQAHPGGGVPLPQAQVIDSAGAIRALGAECPDPATVDPAQIIGPTNIPPGPGTADDPITWLGSRAPSDAGVGDLLVNRDNAYAYAVTDFRREGVILLRGRAPVSPRTRAGAPVMKGGQVRYWSLCAYREPSDRSAACVADEDVPIGRDRRLTIVVGPAERRPANARAACGIAWLPAPASATGLLLLRHVAAAPSFQHTPAAVGRGEAAAAALGAYGPKGGYVAVATVEKLGCPIKP